MHIREFNVINESLFPKKVLAFFNDGTQFGFNNFMDKEITKVGYSINITKDIINQAIKEEVDLILTHHNVWDELVVMQDDIKRMLKENGIVHYFNHLPLDSVDFGPTRTLAKALDVKVVKDVNFWDEFSFGIIGEFDEALELKELEERLDKVLGHKSRIWKNNDRKIKRIGITAGSAGDPASIYEAIEHECDAYITGEKKLKSLIYSEHFGINFILGSHIFTEVGGIKEYARLLSEKMKDVKFIRLKEEHIE